MTHQGFTQCPRCEKRVGIKNGRYDSHSIGPNSHSGNCRMSKQRLQTHGDEADTYEDRARLVADLAHQVQDEDPSTVWDYLTALPADELQRLMMVALAGVPILDRKLDDIFDWVYQLPAAQHQ